MTEQRRADLIELRVMLAALDDDAERLEAELDKLLPSEKRALREACYWIIARIGPERGSGG